MEWLVLMALAFVWSGILTSALRSQRRASPRSSVHAFRRSMGILARNRRFAGRPGRQPAGRVVLVLDDPARVAGRGARPRRSARRRRPPRAASRRSPAARRRLAVLRGLVGAVVVSVVAWGLLGAVGAALLGVSLVALVGYCALLASVRQDPPSRRARSASRRGAPPRARRGDVERQPVAHGA